MHLPTTVRRHPLFILPELRRPGPLTLLILTDGNRRGASSGGYAGGAQRVVAIAEHLARRPDVAGMIACILSPQNVAKRGDGFFRELYQELIQLGVAIEARGALVSAGVRLDVWGDLGSLRERGGHAVALADAVEAVARMTEGLTAPDLRLTLAVGYGSDTARQLGADIVLRTGMEEPGVLRLSGLETGERIATCALTTLWPDVEPREVDAVIDLCQQRAPPRLAAGHSVAAIAAILEALASAQLATPVTATVTLAETPGAMVAAIEGLYAGPLRGCATIAVEYAGHELPAPSRRHPGDDTRHVLRIAVGEQAAGEGELLSVLAPGQRSPVFTLPDWLPLGNANVFACEPTAPGVLEGIRAAQRFAAEHPPLLGGDRAPPRAPGAVAERASERDRTGARFAAKTLEWAASAGILIPGAAWHRAAVSYALTAFFIHLRVPTEWDEAGERWEARADLTARYMLLVAAGDEGIFDRVIAGETPERRWARLEASAHFLQGATSNDGRRARVPDVPGGDLLATIADRWEELLAPHRGSCLPEAEASFRGGLSSLYAGSVAEYRAGIATDHGALTAEALTRRLATAPPCIASRAQALLASASERDARELRALLYLAEAGSAIGAGLLFRTAALAAPAWSVTRGSIALLDAATTLLDYHVRLSNDMSGFLESSRGDRDPKDNACTVLVPRKAAGAAREAAVVQALATCRRLAGWLGGEVGDQLDRVAAAWPSMGVILRRGVFVGRRVYEVGHYTTLSPAQMSAIFDEAEISGASSP